MCLTLTCEVLICAGRAELVPQLHAVLQGGSSVYQFEIEDESKQRALGRALPTGLIPYVCTYMLVRLINWTVYFFPFFVPA